MQHRSSIRAGVALSLLWGCTRHVEYRRDEAAGDIHRLAVVVRVFGRPHAHQTQDKDSRQVSDQLQKSMSDFELAERLRSALQQHLPEGPPFADVAPSAQVESVLGELLVADDTLQKEPNFEELRRIGVDGVLYVQVPDWGADNLPAGGLGMYLKGSGRLFTLPGDETLWQQSFDEHGDSLGAKWPGREPARGSLADLAVKTGEQLAASLGGGTESRRHTESLNQPDIVDQGHPPEKLPPVLPYGFRVDAGAADAGHPLVTPFDPDAGVAFPGLR
jgi:hypothetical protein